GDGVPLARASPLAAGRLCPRASARPRRLSRPAEVFERRAPARWWRLPSCRGVPWLLCAAREGHPVPDRHLRAIAQAPCLGRGTGFVRRGETSDEGITEWGYPPATVSL